MTEKPLSTKVNAVSLLVCFFFFQAEDGIRDHCVTGVQTCALPICAVARGLDDGNGIAQPRQALHVLEARVGEVAARDLGAAFQQVACHGGARQAVDRKSTRLNSSHTVISYAVFCLKKQIRTCFLWSHDGLRNPYQVERETRNSLC